MLRPKAIDSKELSLGPNLINTNLLSLPFLSLESYINIVGGQSPPMP
jgi:hypothetical protein